MGRGQLTIKRWENLRWWWWGVRKEDREAEEGRGQGERASWEQKGKGEEGGLEAERKKRKSSSHAAGQELLGLSYICVFFPAESWVWGRVQRPDRCGLCKGGLPLPSSSLTVSKDHVC